MGPVGRSILCEGGNKEVSLNWEATFKSLCYRENTAGQGESWPSSSCLHFLSILLERSDFIELAKWVSSSCNGRALTKISTGKKGVKLGTQVQATVLIKAKVGWEEFCKWALQHRSRKWGWKVVWKLVILNLEIPLWVVWSTQWESGRFLNDRMRISEQCIVTLSS